MLGNVYDDQRGLSPTQTASNTIVTRTQKICSQVRNLLQTFGVCGVLFPPFQGRRMVTTCFSRLYPCGMGLAVRLLDVWPTSVVLLTSSI